MHRREIERSSIRSLALVAVAGLLAPLTAQASPIDPATMPHLADEIKPSDIGLMPKNTANRPAGLTGDYYEIAVKQHLQQVLPTGLFPSTTMWSFGPADQAANHPAYHTSSSVIVAIPRVPVRVKWINGLSGVTYPDSVHVDQGKHWADPPGPRDTEGESSRGPYRDRRRSPFTCMARTRTPTAMGFRSHGSWLRAPRSLTREAPTGTRRA